MQNSWFIILTFDKNNRISITKESITKEKHIIICSCGYKNIQTEEFHYPYNKNYPFVKCPKCSNKIFIYLTNFQHFHSSLYAPFNPYHYNHLTWNIGRYKTSNSYNANAFIVFPHVDSKNNKLKFIRKKYINLNVSHSGDIQEYHYMDNKEKIQLYVPITTILTFNGEETNKQTILKKLNISLIDFIVQKPSKELKWLKGKSLQDKLKLSLKNIAFFLQYPKVQDFDILQIQLFDELHEGLENFIDMKQFLQYIINHKKQKSLLKTLYRNYCEDIQEKNFYKPQVAYIFSRTIDNIDLLRQLISASRKINNILEDIPVFGIMLLLSFLKKHYNEKQIVRLFLLYNSFSNNYWYDMVQMISSDRLSIENNFIKVPCRLKEIHDEIVRCRTLGTLIHNRYEFIYTVEQLSSQNIIDRLEFRLPKDNLELFEWATILQNCLFSYEDRIKMGSSIIYGVFINSKLCYALEIESGKLLQASGYKNAEVNELDLELIKKWCTKNFFEVEIINIDDFLMTQDEINERLELL